MDLRSGVGDFLCPFSYASDEPSGVGEPPDFFIFALLLLPLSSFVSLEPLSELVEDDVVVSILGDSPFDSLACNLEMDRTLGCLNK